MIQTKRLRKLRNYQAAIAGVALIVSIVPARSQEDGDSPVHYLNKLVVSANRHELPLNQIGSTVDLLEASDLEIGKQSFLLESLRMLPGYYLRNTGGPGATFGMTTRGLNQNRPTFLIDGIDVSHPANGLSINPGVLFQQNVSRVEVIRGPQSSLYGADALGGVVSIDTVSGFSDPQSSLSASIGSNDTAEANLSLNGANGPLSWSISGNHYETDGFSVQNPAWGDAWADDDAYENTAISAKLNYSLGEDSELFFLGYVIDSYSEFDPGVPGPWTLPFEDNYTEEDQLFLKFGGKFVVSDQWNSQLSLGFAEVDTSTNSSFPLETKGDSYQLNWQNTIDVSDNWTAIAGVGYETENSITDVGDRNNTSYFVENIFAASESLDLTLGARLDDNNVYGSETTWRSSFSYRIQDSDTRIRGSYGTSFQAPTFFQLFSFYGEENLKPESGDGWDLGIEQVLAQGNLLFASTIFGYDIDDKINFSFATNKYANEERYQSEGIESSLRWLINESVSARVSHTYSEANYGDGTEAERVPRNVLQAQASWDGLDNRLNINATYLAVSSQFSLRGDAQKQEGYSVINLASSLKISEGYSIWLRIDNVLDEDYEEVADFQTQGTAVYAGARLEF